ncbi:MAG: hypothetical protein QM713_03460 [Arachnia sp.]
MGLLDRILGRGAAEEDTPPAPFDCTAAKAAIGPLADALGALAEAMDTEDAPTANPGWRGRLKDLRGSAVDLRQLAKRGSFQREELFDVLVGVRPLYRGTAPDAYAHLAAQNEAVVRAIAAVEDAAR